jgi:hypothetical protein
MEENELKWDWLTTPGSRMSWPPRYYSAVTTNPWTYSETSFPVKRVNYLLNTVRISEALETFSNICKVYTVNDTMHYTIVDAQIFYKGRLYDIQTMPYDMVQEIIRRLERVKGCRGDVIINDISDFEFGGI